MRRPTGLAAAAALTAVLILAAGAGAQTVTTVGSYDVSLDRRLDRILDDNPLILTSDTLLEAQDTILGPVLVLDATLILEGTILGDLVGVQAGLWLRDPAFILGDVVNIGGGLHRNVARVGGRIMDLQDTRNYRVVREPQRIVIEASGTPSRLALDGPLGLRVPTYDRANGVTATLGAGYSLPIMGAITPTIRAHGGWRTVPGEPAYGGSLELRAGATVLEAGYERGWATHDRWSAADLENALNYLWDGSDYRDYYDVERRWAALRREFGDQAKSFFAVLGVEAQLEDAGSLEGDDPWHIVEGPVRPNPAVDDGRIASLTGRLGLEWHGMETDLVGWVEYEAAREREGGEHTFDRLAARTLFAMHGLLDHTVEIRAFGQLPLRGDTLPRQRWTIVGGAGTLQTLPVGWFRGDHVLMVETRYLIPLPEALAVPVLGPPELQLFHAAGRAWLDGQDDSLVQEIGAGLEFFGVRGRYMLQPDDPAEGRLLVGVFWPLGPAFPWQR